MWNYFNLKKPVELYFFSHTEAQLDINFCFVAEHPVKYWECVVEICVFSF